MLLVASDIIAVPPDDVRGGVTEAGGRFRDYAMNTDHHEQLSTGAAVVTEDDDYPTVRINPIGEDEITVGQSGEPTLWDRDALQTAVEQNALVDPQLGVSEVVEGTGGRNPHHPMDEQVPPKAKLARVEEWEYEEGVGPVAEVQLADEDIAKRVNLGLLDVSADLIRELGEFDEELGARPVERIRSMPRVTVVDRGSAPSASIEPATAEALGYNPDAGAGGLDEDGQDAQTSDEPAESGEDHDTPMPDDKTKEELREQLAAAQAEVTEKEEQVEDLRSEKETLEETKEELESTKEELESEKEELEENNETFQRALAAKYAEQSPMDAEKAMERLEIDDMVEDLDPGPDGDEDDRSPKERLSEQLAAGISLRGQGTEETETGSLSDEDLENAEQLAGSVLSLTDIQRVNQEDISRREYLQREHDVDPVEYGSEDSLRQAIDVERGD